MSENKRVMAINCGSAFLMKDSNGVLDQWDQIKINCGTYVASSEIAAKLAAKGATINCGDSYIQNVKGDVLVLDGGTVIDCPTDYTGIFLLATGDVIFSGEGWRSLENAEGIMVDGTLYHPQSAEAACLAKVRGSRKAYPDGARPLLGSVGLEQLARDAQSGEVLWISGQVTALEERAFQLARDKGLTVYCRSLFTYEGWNAANGGLVKADRSILVPDGHTVLQESPLLPGHLALYGKKLYAKGDLLIDEAGANCLEELESLVVKGCVSLPEKCAAAFGRIGRAESCFLYEGKLLEINGFDRISREQLQAVLAGGERLTIKINGCALFADDITAEEAQAVAALYYNGTVLAGGAAKGILSQRTRQGNGFMGDAQVLEDLTGLSLEALLDQHGNDGGSGLNTGCYILV